MPKFYSDTLQKLVAKRILDRESKILVVCGGDVDRATFVEEGFQNVHISNLDTDLTASKFAPYEWSLQDAESLNFEDDTFDFTFVHSGLHHCHSPHRALLEMYRVSRKGVVCFEPADNLMTRLGVLLNIGQEYEVAAVIDHNWTSGGVANTGIPNFVFRWTRREIEKTIHCYSPTAKHRFLYFYAMRVNWSLSRLKSKPLWTTALLLTATAAWLLSKVVPGQGNHFAFVILKPALPEQLHPWLEQRDDSVGLRRSWVEKRFSQTNSPAPRDLGDPYDTATD